MIIHWNLKKLVLGTHGVEVNLQNILPLFRLKNYALRIGDSFYPEIGSLIRPIKLPDLENQRINFTTCNIARALCFDICKIIDITRFRISD